MATKAIETTILDLEKQYWQAMKDRDAATAIRLTDSPCIVTGPQGIGSIDNKDLAGMIKSTTYTLKSFKLQPGAQVRMLSDDVAIVAYTVHEDLTVEGKPVSLDAAESSTWVRRDGNWLCAMHTEALTGDPFGRDRVQG